jgi:hypothetical protein
MITHDFRDMYHLIADPIACASFPRRTLPGLVDSLDSELRYRSGCRAAALASAAPRPSGSLFGSFSPRGARSKGDQQPDGRVAHNSEALKTSSVSIQGSSPPCGAREEGSQMGCTPVRYTPIKCTPMKRTPIRTYGWRRRGHSL